MRSAGNPLLPCLHTLHLLNVEPEDPVGVTLLLSQTIRHLVLTCSTKRQIAANPAFVLMATSLLPQLHSLRIHGYPYISPRSLNQLPHLNQLHTLTIAHSGIIVDYDALRIISHLTSLEDLTLAVDLSERDLTRPLQLGPGFRALKHLHLCGIIQEIRAILLACGRCPRMQAFGLIIISALSAEMVINTFAIVQDQLTDAITDIQFRILDDLDFSLFSLTDIVEPFFAFPKVDAFLADFAGHIPRMNYDDVSRLTAAWPSLTSFHFICDQTQPPGFDGALKIEGLAEMARRWPLLDYLHLPILDVRTLPSPSDVPRINHKMLADLEVFELRGEETVDIASLAVILDRLFPNLERPASFKKEELTRQNPTFTRPLAALDYARLLMGVITVNRECEQATGEVDVACAHPAHLEIEDSPP